MHARQDPVNEVSGAALKAERLARNISSSRLANARGHSVVALNMLERLPRVRPETAARYREAIQEVVDEDLRRLHDWTDGPPESEERSGAARR